MKQTRFLLEPTTASLCRLIFTVAVWVAGVPFTSLALALCLSGMAWAGDVDVRFVDRPDVTAGNDHYIGNRSVIGAGPEARTREGTVTALAAGEIGKALNAGRPDSLADKNWLLFASEGMHKIVILARDGSIQWEYPAEMSRDVWRLPDGNILFCYNDKYGSDGDANPSGVMEVTPDKRVVFHFRTTGQVWSCQRMTDGNTLVGAASQGKLLIVGRDSSIRQTIKLRGEPGHSCLRNARQVEGGRFLVAEEGSHAVRQYAADGTLLREIKVDFRPYSAVQLANGNTLACGEGTMVEVDGNDRVVWTLKAADLPEMGVRWFAGIQVLPGGSVLICNAGGKVPFFAVNREKAIVWRWPASASAVALGHGVQRLDVTGAPLK